MELFTKGKRLERHLQDDLRPIACEHRGLPGHFLSERLLVRHDSESEPRADRAEAQGRQSFVNAGSLCGLRNFRTSRWKTSQQTVQVGACRT